MMDAMEYEFLIRRVYQCGRHGIKAANADVYRNMEHAQANIDNPDWNKTTIEKENDFRIAFSEVKNNVRNAVIKGLSHIQFRATAEQKKTLEQFSSELRDLAFYDKNRLDEIIDQADEIFRQNGLEEV